MLNISLGVLKSIFNVRAKLFAHPHVNIDTAGHLIVGGCIWTNVRRKLQTPCYLVGVWANQCYLVNV